MKAGENVDEILRRDLSNLDVGASSDRSFAVAEVGGNRGEACQLSRTQFARGNAAAQHEAVLRRRDVEHSEVTEAEGIFFVWELAFRGVGKHAVPTIERMLLMFPCLLLRGIGEGRAKDRG